MLLGLTAARTTACEVLRKLEILLGATVTVLCVPLVTLVLRL